MSGILSGKEHKLTKTLALESGGAGGEFWLSTVYTGRAEATARVKYMFLPAEAEVVNRRRKEAISVRVVIEVAGGNIEYEEDGRGRRVSQETRRKQN